MMQGNNQNSPYISLFRESLCHQGVPMHSSLPPLNLDLYCTLTKYVLSTTYLPGPGGSAGDTVIK